MGVTKVSIEEYLNVVDEVSLFSFKSDAVIRTDDKISNGIILLIKKIRNAMISLF